MLSAREVKEEAGGGGGRGVRRFIDKEEGGDEDEEDEGFLDQIKNDLRRHAQEGLPGQRCIYHAE